MNENYEEVRREQVANDLLNEFEKRFYSKPLNSHVRISIGNKVQIVEFEYTTLTQGPALGQIRIDPPSHQSEYEVDDALEEMKREQRPMSQFKKAKFYLDPSSLDSKFQPKSGQTTADNSVHNLHSSDKGSMNHDHEGLYDSVNKIMIEGSSQSSLDEVDEAMLNQLEDQYESNSNRFKDSNRI